VPILHVCGSLDPWLDRETRVAEKKYKDLGGNFTVIIKQGEGHFCGRGRRIRSRWWISSSKDKLNPYCKSQKWDGF